MNEPRPKALLDHPYVALVAGPLVVRETVFGIVKRVDFFIQHIEAYRQVNGIEADEIRILDVGCGTGVNVTMPLATAGYTVIGIDVDSASIERARRTAQGLMNIEFLCGSLEDLQPHLPFHAIICSEVLEHLKEPVGLVRQIATALKEPGLLLATVPNGTGYFAFESVFWRALSRYPRLVQKLYEYEYRFWKRFGSSEILRRREEEYRPERLELTWSTLAPDTTHYQSFTRPRVIRLLQSQGFRILTARNNTFLAGNLIGLLGRELERFLLWNSRIADRLPSFLVSGWLIAAEKSTACSRIA